MTLAITSMDAVKRASFATKQLPGGPAPLASFEDLPSDELESPEDIDIYPHASDPSFESTSDNTLLSSETPDTVLSTPQIESDFDSHCTLTPVEGNKTCSAIELRTGSLSSLSKEDDSSLSKQKKGSVVSLGIYESSESDFGQRKTSWTDIFSNHNQASKQGDSTETKSPKKKSKSDSSKRDNSEGKSRDRKFLGLFKSGKKTAKTIDSSDDSLKINAESPTILQSLEDVELDSKIDDGKENEQPKKIELLLLQNDLDKSSTATESSYKCSVSSKENDMRNNLNIAEKEYNIFSEPREETNEKTINKEHSTEKEDFESSESELFFEAKEQVQSKKEEDDFEKEILITQDSSEIEDDISIDLSSFPSFLIPQQTISKISRQQRLDWTTTPIERPRSTTPINVAPLEAFIRSSSGSFDQKGEKIKLTLPREQFLMKSPKKNTAKSWTDFCEEGLHSPRMQKKRDDFRHSHDLLESKSSLWDTFDIPETEWVTFEPKTERRATPDLFRDLPITETVFDDGLQAIESPSELVKCSCDCHSQGCENSFIKANEPLSTSSIKIDVFSDKCQCQCHEKYVHLWSPYTTSTTATTATTTTSGGSLLSEICDTLNSSEFASDFASSISAGQ